MRRIGFILVIFSMAVHSLAWRRVHRVERAPFDAPVCSLHPACYAPSRSGVV